MDQADRDDPRSHASRSVMIVDADPSFAAVLRSHLALQGQQLISCTAREAMRDLPSLRPYALILDFDGLSVEGYDLLTSFIGFLEHLPIVICSQHAEPAGPERASLRALGVCAWLRRPCHLDEVSRALAGEPESSPTAREVAPCQSVEF